MTLSTSTVLGNYTHSEPKFIGAFPERKDYPFNTGIYGVKLLNDSNQISTSAPTHSVNIGTPETFEIGDRVRVNEITDPARPDVYKNLSNEFGVVQYVGDICATVEFPQLSDPIWVIPFGSLRKEFAVGDKVMDLNYSKSFGIVKAGPDADGYFTVDFPSSTLKTWYSQLTYIPEMKKSGGDLVIEAGGSNVGIANGSNMNMDSFALNQPIQTDKQSKNRTAINANSCSYSIKFLIAEDVDKSIKVRNEIDQILGSINLPQTTYAATIVLASGRVVDIPAPDPEKWKLSYILKAENNKYATLSIKAWKATDIALRGVDGYGEFQIEHDEGRCWLSDMARIINQKEEISPFETRFSYISEVREYVRKPLETPAYECTMPALRCLW